jgi:2-polyprenyl-3-methyl-5-hydroxy-6-metoxy-1,4-benzoquinol methylase
MGSLMNKFYQSIAGYYDDIFPLNKHQVEFIVSSMNGKTRTGNVLDIGCGTGNLSLELAKHFNKVEAIDLDQEMISIARSKAKTTSSKVIFTTLNMLDIEKQFNPAEFEAILSFGNTMVHLKNHIEIGDLLNQIKKLLKSGGKLFLQIVNYDCILEQNIKALPLINNRKVKFERYYEYIPERDIISFTTVLTVKKKNRIVKNRVELYPLRKNELKKLLQKAGFENPLFFGSFARESFSRTSLLLIVEAEKNE